MSDICGILFVAAVATFSGFLKALVVTVLVCSDFGSGSVEESAVVNAGYCLEFFTQACHSLCFIVCMCSIDMLTMHMLAHICRRACIFVLHSNTHAQLHMLACM